MHTRAHLQDAAALCDVEQPPVTILTAKDEQVVATYLARTVSQTRLGRIQTRSIVRQHWRPLRDPSKALWVEDGKRADRTVGHSPAKDDEARVLTPAEAGGSHIDALGCRI